MKSYQKCIWCHKFADTKDEKEHLTGFCSECKKQVFAPKELTVYKNKNKTKEKIINNIDTLFERTDYYFKIANLKPNENIDIISQPKKEIQSTIHKPSNTPKVLNPVQKSSITFKGEVRSLTKEEQKQNSKISCSYCKLLIDRKLYFYPIVILKCGDGYFHQRCFAKFMAEGNTECPNCHKNFFTRDDSQNDADDSEDDGNFF